MTSRQEAKNKAREIMEDLGIENEKYEEIGNKKTVELPKSGKLISEFINELVPTIKEKNILFYRSDSHQIVNIGKVGSEKENDKFFTGFIQVTPSSLITLLENYFIPGNFIFKKIEEDFVKIFKSKSITKELGNTILSSYILKENLKKIDRIFTIPLPIIYKGKLIFPKKGYDERFNSWRIDSSPEITNLEMSLEESKKVINEILEGFCFQSNEDYTIAVSSLITPLLRGLYPAFNCRTPLNLFLGNRERVGKDYLAGVNGLIYEGVALEEPPLQGNKSNSDEELRKKIVSAFLSGRKRLHFSNNKGYINNAILEAILTAKTYSDRLLGKNESPIFDNELEFSLSGNMGIGFTPDLANRSRIINLFFDREDANSRIFKKPDLHKWVLDNRELILSAIYGLINNWVKKECPKGSKPFSSFPEWAEICGGVMEAGGYDSPCLQNKGEFNIGGDSEKRDMTELFEICYEKCPESGLTKREIRSLISNEEIFSFFDFDKKSDQIKFGNKIIKFEGRILSDIKMNLVDSAVKRKANQKYIFKKLESDYNLEEKCNVCNLCNPHPSVQHEMNIISSIRGETLHSLQTLQNNTQNSCNEDKKRPELVKTQEKETNNNKMNNIKSIGCETLQTLQTLQKKQSNWSNEDKKRLELAKNKEEGDTK